MIEDLSGKNLFGWYKHKGNHYILLEQSIHLAFWLSWEPNKSCLLLTLACLSFHDCLWRVPGSLAWQAIALSPWDTTLRQQEDPPRRDHLLTLDLWLAKDNRFLIPKSSYKWIHLARPCRFILCWDVPRSSWKRNRCLGALTYSMKAYKMKQML